MIRLRAWLPELIIGACASATALLLQDVLRTEWQVRTLPERVEEWLLLFVSLDLFEKRPGPVRHGREGARAHRQRLGHGGGARGIGRRAGACGLARLAPRRQRCGFVVDDHARGHARHGRWAIRQRPADLTASHVLRSLPSVEVVKTLECISNFTAMCNLASFGCDLLSTARFRGARVSDVLALAGGLKQTAVGLAVRSIDEFSAGLPSEVVDDPECLVVYERRLRPRLDHRDGRLSAPG